jgi:hypothetical protein
MALRLPIILALFKVLNLRHLRMASVLAFLVAPTLVLVLPSTALADADPIRTRPLTGPQWSDLTTAQQTALAPLQGTWPELEARRKEKWLKIARSMATMAPEDRQRVQARMADWARMTPAQREKTRLGFQEVKSLTPEERAARWKAYQSLPPEEKRRLAQRGNATPATSPMRSEKAPPATQTEKSKVSADKAVAPLPRSTSASDTPPPPDVSPPLTSNPIRPDAPEMAPQQPSTQ